MRSQDVLGWTAPTRHRMCQACVCKQAKEAVHERDYQNWHRSVEACFPGARCKRSGTNGVAQDVAAGSDGTVFCRASCDPDRNGSLRFGASLGARAARSWARGAAAAATIRQAVRETREERCGRCGGDLRGAEPAVDALRAGAQQRQPGRGHAAEFGVTGAKGSDSISALQQRIATTEAVPELAREILARLFEQIRSLR